MWFCPPCLVEMDSEDEEENIPELINPNTELAI